VKSNGSIDRPLSPRASADSTWLGKKFVCSVECRVLRNLAAPPLGQAAGENAEAGTVAGDQRVQAIAAGPVAAGTGDGQDRGVGRDLIQREEAACHY
jgi:hypothetical protein